MFDQLIVVVTVTCVVMVIPGPDMLLVLRNTFLGGRHAGLKSSCGVLSGNLVHITYCLLGIGWVVSRSILAFSAMKYAAAAYALGAIAFAVAHAYYVLFINDQYAAKEPQRWLSPAQQAGHERNRAAGLGASIGSLLWFVATALFVWALWHIKP